MKYVFNPFTGTFESQSQNVAYTAELSGKESTILFGTHKIKNPIVVVLNNLFDEVSVQVTVTNEWDVRIRSLVNLDNHQIVIK